VIVDASVIIDAVVDPGPRGHAARGALADVAPEDPLVAPGHFAVEILSGLWAAARRPSHPLRPEEVPAALESAEAIGIEIEGTPWSDVARAWALSRQSLRYTDAVYVAAAERRQTSLLTADARLAISGSAMTATIITVEPAFP
jgi:predicted nucleic acid-binding protein